MKFYRVFTLLTLLMVLLSGCEKKFLDIKTDKKLVVPRTIGDAQAILDDDIMFAWQPYLGENGSDDFYLEFARYTSLQPVNRNAFVWAKDIYEAGEVQDWNFNYRKVFSANTALETLDKLSPTAAELNSFNNAKGMALFYRAWAFYSIAQLFCKTYIPATASTDLGIPIRLSSNLNEKSVRASVAHTYAQIIKDLNEALALLPSIGQGKTRPSKAACYAMLARVFLVMGDYQSAYSNADRCLQLYSTLLDYRTLNPSLSFPIGIFNEEVIFHSAMENWTPFISSRLIVDDALFSSYAVNDLRKTVFFFQNAGKNTYKGSYTGSSKLWGGIAVDEVYLTRSEAAIRIGMIDQGLSDVNFLLSKRFKTGTYLPLVTADKDVALKFVLDERRKELIYRGLRWTDLRRLNLDPVFAKTLTRNLNGEVFTLLPNDVRYVLPIPDNVIALSGMQQNPR